jgi:hypothetical protein
MEAAAILALVEKGITIGSALLAAGMSAAPAFAAIGKLFDRETAITQSDLDETEAVLDALLDQFNIELPPE